ncbi:hypothetical protein [Shouchella lonarensis]|nr:hypothetical protein [Shouchella lonarensis]
MQTAIHSQDVTTMNAKRLVLLIITSALATGFIGYVIFMYLLKVIPLN